MVFDVIYSEFIQFCIVLPAYVMADQGTDVAEPVVRG